MYNMLLCTRSVPVLAEIVIVGHSRWRMSCRPVRHTGHLARQPLVEGGRGRVLLSSSLLSFFFLLTKSCAQVVLLTITGSHSNSGRSQSSSPFLSSPQLGTRGSTTSCLFPPAALRCETHLLLAAPQLTQLLSPDIIALSLRLAVGIGIIV